MLPRVQPWAVQKSKTLFDTAAPVALEVKRNVRQESLESQQFRSYLTMAYAIAGDLERAEGLVREQQIAGKNVLKNAQVDIAIIEPLQTQMLQASTAEFAVALARAGRFEESRSLMESIETSVAGIARHGVVAAIRVDTDVKELSKFYEWLRSVKDPAARGAAFAGVAAVRRPRQAEEIK